MERASVEMTRTIEIEQFVDLSQIDIRFFDRPYLLVPTKNGEKGYVLLREAIAASGKAGIANVVIRSRQHLGAVIASGDAILLALLRYQQELRNLDEFDLPGTDLRKWKISKKEIELASQLIEGMTSKWNPRQYHDEYHDVLMKLIEKKIKSGQTEAIEVESETETDEEPQTINFMEVLKKSVAKTAHGRSAKKTTSRKKTVRRRKTSKKKAG
jgi:DNA end-binding protein Ku